VSWPTGTRKVRGTARRNSDALQDGEPLRAGPGRCRSVAPLRCHWRRCSVSPLAQQGAARSVVARPARSTSTLRARVSIQGMSPGTTKSGSSGASSSARAIAPAGPAPQQRGWSTRNSTADGRTEARRRARSTDEVETVNREAMGRTARTTRAKAGRPPTGTKSLSRPKRRDRPPASTRTRSRERSGPGSAGVVAVRDPSRGMTSALGRGAGGTGPPGFEPGFEAPEASVMSKLYYGPAVGLTERTTDP
jgi:hypothetical protein